jgi:hypothetical protein
MDALICEGCGHPEHGSANVERLCLLASLRRARAERDARYRHGVTDAVFEANQAASQYFQRTRVK